ncbi:MAG: DegT/DnrJ/EryC1/StrS family aminotransferase [Myxococcota bacterium]
MMSIPFVDLAARHREAADAIEPAVLEILRSGRWVGGDGVARAEAIAARWLGRSGAVGVASGTDALILALQAVGIGRGDEVVVPAVTFFATAGAVLAVGAQPVIADVGDDGLLDPEAAAAVCGPATRAVIPVHLFGSVARPLALDLVVIDDAAQAIGADRPGVGVLAAVSTYPTKTWGTAGDGGFVVGDDPELLGRVRRLANHGAIEPGVYDLVTGHAGRASRLDAVHAAVLVGHAAHLADRVARRRALAARYDDGMPRGLRIIPRSPGSAVHVYNVRTPDRDRLAKALADRGIGTAVYYPRPLHHQPALRGAPLRRPAPVAEALCREILALPIADLSADQVDRVLDALRAEVR